MNYEMRNLPDDSPFEAEIRSRLDTLRDRFTSSIEDGEDPSDVDYHYIYPEENELVREALMAHEIFEIWLEETQAA